MAMEGVLNIALSEGCSAELLSSFVDMVMRGRHDTKSIVDAAVDDLLMQCANLLSFLRVGARLLCTRCQLCV
jgi:hypothetical protein